LSVELEENFIAVDAGTVTGAPVCGLRPVRALRLVVLNEPKPGHATFSPFVVVETTTSKNAATVRSASALVTFAFSATASMSSALVIFVLPPLESERCAEKANVTKADAERTVAAFFEVVVSTTTKGEKVAWPGFGSFSTTSRKARTGRNPQTGAPVTVPASTAMKFSSSSTLKAELNPKK